jgi:hypothetical protein
MFPDLRLLISATVATFFLTAMAGLYASLRITQDQIAARTEGRTVIDESPITRISAGWPLLEPSRAAALRELAKIAKASPTIPDEKAGAIERGEPNAAPEATQSGMPETAGGETRATLKDSPAQDATGSTGTAAPADAATGNQVDHPDIQGNIGDPAVSKNAATGLEKVIRLAPKKIALALKKKRLAKIQRRKIFARSPETPPVDLTNSGYPLYLTVPVTN